MNSNKTKTDRQIYSYHSIIKENSKFYVSINDNIQFLLNPNEIAIFLKVIHINNIGKNKQSKEYFSLTTRLSKRTIDKTLEQLVRYGLIHIQKTGKTNNAYTLNLEVIQGIYKSLNSIKEIEGKQRWCEIYIQNATSSKDSRGAEFVGSEVQNLHVEGAKIVKNGVQILHPNKKNINKKYFNKENFREGEFEVERHIEFNTTDNLVSDTNNQCEVSETATTDINDIEDMDNRSLDDSRTFEERNNNSIQLDLKVSENSPKETKNTLSNEDSDIEVFYEKETDRMLDNYQTLEDFTIDYNKVLSQLNNNYPKEINTKYINQLKRIYTRTLKRLAETPETGIPTYEIEKALESTGLKDLYNSFVA